MNRQEYTWTVQVAGGKHLLGTARPARVFYICVLQGVLAQGGHVQHMVHQIAKLLRLIELYFQILTLEW